MKKGTFLTIGLVLVSLIQSFAQIQKGNSYISGSLAFTQSQTESITTFFDFNSNQTLDANSSFEIGQISIRPEFGYLVSSNLAIGLGIDYSRSFRTNTFQNPLDGSNIPNVDKNTTNTYSILPFLRYYTPFNQKAGFSFDLRGQIGLGDINIIDNNDTEIMGEQSVLGFSVTPTFYYFVTSRLAIEANLGGLTYISTTSEYNDLEQISSFLTRPTDQNGFSLTFGSSFNIGLSLYFGNTSNEE